MKKMITMAFVAITMMTSCSDDDSSNTNNPDPSGPLLTKVIETYGDDSQTTFYYYDGNRLTHFGSDETTGYDFTYTGDKLTKMELVTDTEEVHYYTFQYNQEGKLSVLIGTQNFTGMVSTVRTEYTHNSNGTISYETYSGDENSQTELVETGTIIMENGNVVEVNYESDGEEWTDTFTYDNKNAPLKNMHAYEVYALAFHGGLNNILTSYYEEDDMQETSTYTYNADGYPVTSTDTWNGEFDGDYEYFYK